MDFRRALAPFIAFLVAAHAVCGSASPAPDAPQSAAATAEAPNHILESFRHDASLADVCFINPTTGWAVGDHGVIWHTHDAGTTWTQQSSNVSCPLHSVFFIDARRGWIVGGDSHTSASRGIVLRTLDGGNHWDAIPHLILPQLARVKFFDQQQGIAIGAAAPTQPSGVFLTQDGGDSWQPIPSDHDGGWLTGDFLDPQAGALAGAAGRTAQLARQKVVQPPLQMHSPRAFRALRLLPPTAGWLVGDGGLILTTPDLGRTWQSPPGDVARPGEVASATGLFDLQALAALGPRVWTAGAPGSRVFHSPDNGQTWLSFPTGQLAPIRALAFIDDHHGWAVGDLGNILATSDGGQTWKPQRTGGSRAALLGIFAHAADVPLEVLAAHAAADGYRTAIDILHPPAPGEVASATGPFAHPTPHRHRQALLLAGASHVNTAWRFPLPPSDLAHTPADLLAALNRDSDGRAVEQIEQHLVRSIRTWRPDVIITPQPNPESCPPRQAILAALVMQSITTAADPSRHADLASAGLEPWQVKKVYALLPTGSHGAESIETNQFSPLLGTTLGSFVDPARESLAPTPAKPPLRYDFDLLTATIQDAGGPRGLFAGLSLAPGADPRRPQPAPPADDLDQLRRIAERRQQLEALLSRTEGNDAWAAQIAQLTHDLNANDGAPLMTQLADSYRAAGRLDLAADTYYLLARRYPDHAHATRALQWLVHFYASSEMSHRLTSRTPQNIRQASFEPPPGEAASAAGAADTLSASVAAPALSPDDRLHRATQLAEYLRSSKPELYADPRVRFAEVAALRQLGLVNPAKRYHLALRQLPDANPWRQCGETEIWLAQPADAPPPKPLGACRPTTQRPRLDAQLNDPFWNTADRLRLSDDESTNTPPAEVRLAYDNEHLYIAIRCQKAPSPQPPAPTPPQPRPRDADLSQHDRVTLRFDIDRDFTTAFELTVDSRGWTHDTCWNDAHWNPTWYVAAASDDATWTIEAAVPLAELVETPPAARHVWAVAASRTIPRVGFQHWASTAPADDSPDLFGFLLFE